MIGQSFGAQNLAGGQAAPIAGATQGVQWNQAQGQSRIEAGAQGQSGLVVPGAGALIEDPQVVKRKAQDAAKVLADSIANRYIIKLNKDAQNNPAPAPRPVMNPNLNAQTEAALKALADSIGQKYQFVKQSEAPVPAPVPAPIQVPVPAPIQVPIPVPPSPGYKEIRGQPKVYENRKETLIGQFRGAGPNQSNLTVRKDLDSGLSSVVDKHFDVIVEKPVVKEIIVEKPYEVIIEKPVENIVQKEILIERVIENPIERIIEKPVERIVHRNVEQIIEKPVEVIEYVDRKVENIIVQNVEKLIDKPVYVTRNVDKPVTRTIVRPIRNEVQINEIIQEVPVVQEQVVVKNVEKVYQKVVDVPYDVVVDRQVIKEVERTVYQDVVKERQVPVPVDRIVEVEEVVPVRKSVTRQVFVQKPYEKIVEVDRPFTSVVDKVVEVPHYVDVVVEVPVDKFVEVPVVVEKKVQNRYKVFVDKEVVVDKVVEVQKDKIVEVPVYVNKPVEIPVEKKVAKYVEQLTEKYRDVDVVRENVIQVPRIVEKKVCQDKHVKKLIERDRVIEVPVERVINKEIFVDKIEEVPVYIDKVVEVMYDNIVEKRVEVPIERYVEVPREIKREKIIEVETLIDRPVIVENVVQGQSSVIGNSLDEQYNREFYENEQLLRRLDSEYREWTSKLTLVQGNKFKTVETSTSAVESKIGYDENQQLRRTLNELHERYNNVVAAKNRELANNMYPGQPRKSGLGGQWVVSGNESVGARPSYGADSYLIPVSTGITNAISVPVSGLFQPTGLGGYESGLNGSNAIRSYQGDAGSFQSIQGGSGYYQSGGYIRHENIAHADNAFNGSQGGAGIMHAPSHTSSAIPVSISGAQEWNSNLPRVNQQDYHFSQQGNTYKY